MNKNIKLFIFLVIIVFSVFPPKNVFAGVVFTSCPGTATNTIRTQGEWSGPTKLYACSVGACNWATANFVTMAVTYSIDGGNDVYMSNPSQWWIDVGAQSCTCDVCKSGSCGGTQEYGRFDTGNINISGLSAGTHTITIRTESSYPKPPYQGEEIDQTKTCTFTKQACVCSTGTCCTDGCNYNSSSSVCSTTTEYRCAGTACGDDYQKRTKTQYCSGSSASCTGTSTYSAWITQTACTGTQKCYTTAPNCRTEASCTNASPNLPTLLTPTQIWMNYSPDFTARVSDPNVSDTIRAIFELTGYGTYNGNYVANPGTSGYDPGSMGDGEYWWRAFAQDNQGAVSAWTNYWWFGKDTVIPTASIDQENGTSPDLNISVALTEADDRSGVAEGDVEVRINSGVWTDYSTTINDFTYTGINHNIYEFRYRVKDNANNWSNYAYDGSVTIDVNTPPTDTNTSVTPSDPCTQPTQYYTFRWTYTDVDNDIQKRLDFQVDNNADFSSPEVSRSYDNLSGPVWASPNVNSQIVSLGTNPTTPGCDYLTYNTTYYWRSKVYDEHYGASAWVTGTSFKTGIHHYPLITFTWDPVNPNTNETVQFNDTSKCWDEDAVNGAGCSPTASDIYQWTFPSGTPATSTAENPSVKFSAPGDYIVSLRITDGDGYACTKTQTVSVDYPMPRWREIRPF